MPSIDNEMAQDRFMRDGGILVEALTSKFKSGELSRYYIFNEYPKMICISRGVQKFERSTETHDKKTKTWTEEREVFDEIVVQSEDEEERVLSGGKTSAAIEDERQSLIRRARANGLNTDPSWSTIRLKRELGDALNAPPPIDELDMLREKMARLQQISDLKAQIATMEAGAATLAIPAPVAERDDLRAQLTALGVQYDGRWSVNQLREKLDQATAPGVRVA